MLPASVDHHHQPTTRIFLLRHAESARPDVFHGAESDIGLSERGLRQAAAVAPLLAAERPDVLVSSAMRRARETAAPIAEACGLEPQIEPQLHERRVGALCGTVFERKEGVWPDTLRRWMAGDTKYAPEGAESFDHLRDRVLPVWQRLTTQHAGRSIVVVAHGVVCKILLLSLLERYSPADWARLGPIRNVAFTELVLAAGRCEAVRINELSPIVERIS